MTRVERFSVRELISALARLEDELRAAGPAPTADGARDRWLEARERAILQELRQRSPDIARCADVPEAQSDSGMPRVPEPMSDAAPASAQEALASDPDAGGVGHGAEGDQPGQGLLRTLGTPQDDVGGAA